VRGLRATAAQFPLPTGNRVAVQAGDLCQPDNAAATMLESKKAGNESPRLFVGDCDEAVDSAMLARQRTMRVLLAGSAGACMDVMLGALPSHTTTPP
jgi:hypothetical protein